MNISASLQGISLDVSAESLGHIDRCWKTYLQHFMSADSGAAGCIPSDGPFRKNRSEGEEDHLSLQTSVACVCTQAPHREAWGQSQKLLGTRGALAHRVLPLGRASSLQMFCSKGGTCEASAGTTRPCSRNPSLGC